MQKGSLWIAGTTVNLVTWDTPSVNATGLKTKQTPKMLDDAISFGPWTCRS